VSLAYKSEARQQISPPVNARLVAKETGTFGGLRWYFLTPSAFASIIASYHSDWREW
jgi:hypothetical protein